MKIKTSELKGNALDWAVAKCEGKLTEWINDTSTGTVYKAPNNYYPSTDWALAGPIIEREKISSCIDYIGLGNEWNSETHNCKVQTTGPTPLISAMRCYVASKLGDEVEIPKELS